MSNILYLEKLNEDLIEDHFFVMFKPMYFITKVLGSARFQFKDKFILCTSTTQKIWAIVVSILTSFSLYHLFIGNPFYPSLIDPILLGLGILHSVLTLITYISVIVSNVFLYTSESSVLYVTLQNIDKILKLNERDGRYLYTYRKNIVQLIFWCLYQALTFCSYYWYVVDGPVVDMVMTVIFYFSLLVLDTENICFSCIIELLQIRLRYINKILNEHLVTHDQKLQEYSAPDTFPEKSDIILKAYRNITVAYTLMNKLYCVYVSTIYIIVTIKILSSK